VRFESDQPDGDGFRIGVFGLATFLPGQAG
jgi:hypothetical protein